MDLATLLQATFSPEPTIRRDAERALEEMQKRPGFGILPLELTKTSTADRSTRQAAALLYKNYVKGNWKAVGSFWH